MIDGTLVLQYVKCPRFVWNKYFAPPEEQIEVHEFMRKKMEEGLFFEREYVKKLPHEEFRYSGLKDGFEKTIQLMKKGAKRIYHPVLLFGDYVGIPDLIEKGKGKSVFGNYFYFAGDVKSSLRVKEEQRMQVVFYNYLLSKIQGYLPERGFLVMRDSRRELINISENIRKLKRTLEIIKEIKEGLEISPTINSKCTFCPWKDYCFAVALKRDDISMIKGLGSSAKKVLNALGIYKIKDVMKMDIDKIWTKEFSKETLKKWKLQAESLEKGKIIKLKDVGFHSTSHEIYLDLESEDTTKVVYLIGLLVNGQTKQFVALNPKDEKNNFLEFVKYVISLKEFIIYHFGSFEKSAFQELFKKYSVEEKYKNKIMDSMVDLLSIVNQTVVLPLHNYSLKTIAKYLGFKWTDKKADAAESMYWYDLWLKTKNKKWLELSKRYNEDDLKATKIIKEWLEKL